MALSLDAITISNLNQVKIESFKGNLFSGRKFKVILTTEAGIQTSTNLSFKAIVHKLNQLAKINKNFSDEENYNHLKLCESFIYKLKSVNESADKDYALKGNGYKFLTWITRLFDLYSPGKRIKQFSRNVHKKETKVFKKFKEKNQNLPLDLNKKPINQFIVENRILFLSTVKKGNTSRIATKDNNLQIKENYYGELHINFNKEGAIRNILINGKSIDLIPEPFESILYEEYEYHLLKYNSYKAEFKIVMKSLSQFPNWHLNKYISYLKSPTFDSYDVLKVTFIDENLEKLEGIKGERTYVSQLIMALQLENSLFHEGKDGLKFPRITRTFPTVYGKDVIPCSKSESEFYSNLGTLMHWCYEDETLLTGLFFSDILFHVALEFSYKELSTSFSDLNCEVLLRISKRLVNESSSMETRLHCLQCLELLEKDKIKNILTLNDDDAKESLKKIVDIGLNDYLDEGTIDIKKIKENPNLFYSDLFEKVFSSENFIDSLNGTSLSQILAPIHSLAKGMAERCDKMIETCDHWDDFSALPVAKVATQIQGEFDRQKIHDALTSGSDEIDKEFQWLQIWVLHESSDEELKKFLQFVSGSTALPSNQKIEVSTAIKLQAKSNYFEIHLPITDNKEDFINNLKQTINKL